MNNTEELNTILQREVAELHQTIGGLMVRIESLEKQKECLVKVGAETSANLNVLKDKFYAQLDEAGLVN
jgi:prefoldin subunit 5